MRINIEDIQVSDEMVCKFMEGMSTSDEDRMILAKMRIDREFAREVKDLMEAMEVLSEMDEKGLSGKEDYPYTTAAFASFATRDSDYEACPFSSSTKSTDDLANDFLDGYDEEEMDENPK